jgi:glycosyltransferase involved in cell wall biosynthesis
MLAEHKSIELNVFYTWSQSENGRKFDPGFGKTIEWDIPLLNGYNFTFVNNISSSPGSHHFNGINNPTLINEIEDWGADAILVYGWSFKSHLKAIRFFKGKIPVFFRGDSTLIDEKPGVKKLLRRIYLTYIYSYINVAMYVGQANKDYFLAHGIKENQLAFMPHAIENKRFQKNECNINGGNEIRKSLGIPEHAFIFLFAGKLETKKQPDFLANAFLSICDENSYLLIVGNGHLGNTLKSDFSANNKIRFLDFQNQNTMPSLYAACNVFVLPSKGPSETWGLAVNEAMAAGKPVIVSNACGVAYDLVKNGKNGFVFKNGDLMDIKKCMQYFIDNKNRTEDMGDFSFKIIETYSYENDCVAIVNQMSKLNKTKTQK